jgi:rubrerythrin
VYLVMAVELAFALDQTVGRWIMPLLRTSLLGTEPAGTLHSLDELFALASAMEQEAATRYGELAEEMRLENKSDLSALFTQLAAAEREHANGVTRWSQSLLGRTPDPALVHWEGPRTFDAEAAAEIMTSRLMTPYRALSIAVRNEERAFAFWSYVAAFAQDTEIKEAAEAMAREELAHVSTLRRERRRAYHSERDAARAGQTSRAEAVAGHVDAATLERRLALHLAGMERDLAGTAANRTRELSQETKAMAVQAVGLGRFPASVERADAQTIAEALTDAYLEGAEETHDPQRLQSLQALAERAIVRLAWLRSLNP